MDSGAVLTTQNKMFKIGDIFVSKFIQPLSEKGERHVTKSDL